MPSTSRVWENAEKITSDCRETRKQTRILGSVGIASTVNFNRNAGFWAVDRQTSPSNFRVAERPP
jgi:hypothetical protein